MAKAKAAPKMDKYDSPKLEGGKKDLKADAKEAKQPSKNAAAKGGKMSMKQYETSAADKTSDNALAKKGIKEGSKREQAIDRKEIAAINKKATKKK